MIPFLYPWQAVAFELWLGALLLPFELSAHAGKTRRPS